MPFCWFCHEAAHLGNISHLRCDVGDEKRTDFRRIFVLAFTISDDYIFVSDFV